MINVVQLVSDPLRLGVLRRLVDVDPAAIAII